MYICIDVGGTKTLIAAMDEGGKSIEQIKIPTSKDYQQFIEDVAKEIDKFQTKSFEAGTVGVPDIVINRNTGLALRFGNLSWQNVPIGPDLKKITGCQIFVENDAKLAGLSEAILIKGKFSKVLYLTIGTGIGYAAINDLKIDIIAGDGGGRILLVKKGDNYVPWESLISGRLIVEKYGQMAKDIFNPNIWQEISADLAEGLITLISVFLPEAVVIGGSVGNYFDRYSQYLSSALKKYQVPMLDMPVLMKAARPDEAVIYGCYEYTKQKC